MNSRRNTVPVPARLGTLTSRDKWGLTHQRQPTLLKPFKKQPSPIALKTSGSGAAVAIGVLAMLLAISSLGGGNATKEMLNANIQASDTFAFYQAKTIRQTSTQLAADALEALLLTQPNMSADARGQIQQRIDALQGNSRALRE